MEGLLQLLLYGFIYWLIMGRRSKKKRKAARKQEQKTATGSPTAPPTASREPAGGPIPEGRPERVRPATSIPADRPEGGRREVFEEDEGEFYDPFDELRDVLMQEGRAEERGYRPSHDRSPDLRGRLERMRERRSEAERRRQEKLRAMEAEREGRTVADVVAFDDEREAPASREAPRETAVDRAREARRRVAKRPRPGRHALLANLRDSGRAREAIVLREVLGPPVAKRGQLGTSMRPPRDR